MRNFTRLDYDTLRLDDGRILLSTVRAWYRYLPPETLRFYGLRPDGRDLLNEGRWSDDGRRFP